MLLVAPMSGHFATLLRGTVKTLLQDHDVYITDWHNARDVSLKHGPFALDDYIDHMIQFTEAIGPGTHVVAVCQPCVAALAATAIMAEDDNPAQPRSLTLMAGPVDTSNGNLIDRSADVSLASVGPDLEIVRSYNSLDTRVGAFGRGRPVAMRFLGRLRGAWSFACRNRR